MFCAGGARKAGRNSRFKVNLILKTRPRKRNGRPVVIIVGKSVLKGAVDRNLLKRRIRSLLLPISKKMKTDFLVTVKPLAAKMSFADLKEEISNQIPDPK